MDIDIEDSDSLLNYLNAELQTVDSVELPIASGCCIYRVPPKLREVKEVAYTPTLVSIGPFHHGDERLESMQEIKFWHFNHFLKRPQQKSLKDYIKDVRNWEDEIRRCYSETIPMKSDKFVSIILTDACFIIEFFLARLHDQENPLLKKPWLTDDIVLDLILLENQLPFFVLERLFSLINFPPDFTGPSTFLEVAFLNLRDFFIVEIYPSNEMSEKFTFSDFENRLHNLSNGNSLQVLHLCDMLRTFYIPSVLPLRKSHGEIKRSYTASQLHEAGIKFQVVKDKSIISGLQCSKGTLKIPTFAISAWTETMLRNVVAFEQWHHPSMHFVTDYIVLLDYLISTGKDVEILVENGIMENLCGDNNEVASMVNKLCSKVSETNISSGYVSLYAELNKYCDNPYNKYKAIFVHEYWNTPWKKASCIAAVVLLLLTFIQTICSVISLFNNE